MRWSAKCSRASGCASERSEIIVIYVGDVMLHQPGEHFELEIEEIVGLAARIGGRNMDDVWYVVRELRNQGLIEDNSSGSYLRIQLTFSGWQLYDELKQKVVESRIAFMAMPFGDSHLDRIYRLCFKPAVEAAGFTLRRIDENPPAGSIINRMRVEIQRARFSLVELSSNNPGAYWEAGFAEGLGRPVIYTCEKGKKTHFDTRQLLTVFWSDDDLKGAISPVAFAATQLEPSNPTGQSLKRNTWNISVAKRSAPFPVPLPRG